MKRLAKFARLPGPDRLLFLEAALWLGIARLAIRLVPFRRIAPFLGKHMTESPQRIAPAHRRFAERISWAIKTARRHMPWEGRCLVQAMAAKGMLKLRGFQSTIYLGLAKEGEVENLKAHAWLRTGDMIVVGTRGNDRFTVVSTFAEES
jgi:hypothetical protein